MKSFELTLYDFFGYLIPGCAAAAGVYLAVWGLLLKETQDLGTVTAAGWSVFLAVAYVIGHAVQAIATTIPWLTRSDTIESSLGHPKKVPELVVERAKTKAQKLLKLPYGKELNDRTLFEAVDYYIVQNGKTATRDIFIYREGFYKGLVVALIVLAGGALLRMTGINGKIQLFGTELLFTKTLCILLAAGSIFMAFLFYDRYRRFIEYSVKNAIYGFLAAGKEAEKES